MTEQIAPVLGDWLISPSGKKWCVTRIREEGIHTVYELQRASSERQGVHRDMYLTQLARWKKTES